MVLRVNDSRASLSARQGISDASEAISRVSYKFATGLNRSKPSENLFASIESSIGQAQLRYTSSALANLTRLRSILSTRNGALETMRDGVQTLADMALQASGTLPDEVRASNTSIFSEVLSRVANLAKTAEYAGIKLIDGSFGSSGTFAGDSTRYNVTVSPDDTFESTVGAGRIAGFYAPRKLDVTIASIPSEDDTITINGKVLTFKNSAKIDLDEVQIGATIQDTALNIVSAIAESSADELKAMSASITGAASNVISFSRLTDSGANISFATQTTTPNAITSANSGAGFVISEFLNAGSKATYANAFVNAYAGADPAAARTAAAAVVTTQADFRTDLLARLDALTTIITNLDATIAAIADVGGGPAAIDAIITARDAAAVDTPAYAMLNYVATTVAITDSGNANTSDVQGDYTNAVKVAAITAGLALAAQIELGDATTGATLNETVKSIQDGMNAIMLVVGANTWAGIPAAANTAATTPSRIFANSKIADLRTLIESTISATLAALPGLTTNAQKLGMLTAARDAYATTSVEYATIDAMIVNPSLARLVAATEADDALQYNAVVATDAFKKNALLAGLSYYRTNTNSYLKDVGVAADTANALAGATYYTIKDAVEAVSTTVNGFNYADIKTIITNAVTAADVGKTSGITTHMAHKDEKLYGKITSISLKQGPTASAAHYTTINKYKEAMGETALTAGHAGDLLSVVSFDIGENGANEKYVGYLYQANGGNCREMYCIREEVDGAATTAADKTGYVFKVNFTANTNIDTTTVSADFATLKTALEADADKIELKQNRYMTVINEVGDIAFNGNVIGTTTGMSAILTSSDFSGLRVSGVTIDDNKKMTISVTDQSGITKNFSKVIPNITSRGSTITLEDEVSGDVLSINVGNRDLNATSAENRTAVANGMKKALGSEECKFIVGTDTNQTLTIELGDMSWDVLTSGLQLKVDSQGNAKQASDTLAIIVQALNTEIGLTAAYDKAVESLMTQMQVSRENLAAAVEELTAIDIAETRQELDVALRVYSACIGAILADQRAYDLLKELFSRGL